MEIREVFALNLKRLRRARALSQEELLIGFDSLQIPVPKRREAAKVQLELFVQGLGSVAKGQVSSSTPEVLGSDSRPGEVPRGRAERCQGG